MRAVSYRLAFGIIAALALAAPTTMPLAAPAAAQQQPTLTPADYAKWETLGATELAPDGRWLAYVVSRVDEDGELRYRAVTQDSTHVVRYAARPVFSADSRWLAYTIGLPRAERERLERANQPQRGKVGIVDLRSGVTTVIDNISGFEFSGDGRHIVLRGYAPRERASHRGVDIMVRDLSTGTMTNFGNVAVHQWQDGGALLAMIIDAENRAGNGVRLFDAGTGVLRTLDSDTATYTGLAWRKDADDLAVLRVRTDPAHEEPAHTVIAWRGVAGSRLRRSAFDPAASSAFPAGHRVVEHRPLRWSENGATLFFGIREWTRKPEPPAGQRPQAPADTAADAAADTAATRPAPAPRTAAAQRELAGVEVWHAGDIDIIPEQKVRANMERTRSQLAAWHLNDDRFVRLGADVTEDVTLSDGRFALGVDGRPYDRERMFGPAYRDLWVIDVNTGERDRAVERVQFHYGLSATGRYLLYVRDGHYWTYDTRARRHTNITADVPTSFINLENDHTIPEKPPFGTGGWTTGDRSVLLYDKYDVWEVRPDGTRATNLTRGADERVRHRRLWLDPDHRVVDMSKPVYLGIYGDRTKQSGFARLRPGAAAERLVFLHRNVGRLAKAKDADVYYYRVEGFDQSPNWFVGGPRLADARQVTDTNPFQSEYAWGRSELIDFRNDHGHELQAALLYPAGYEPGRQYPMIVYFYEITSNTVHNYSVPSEYSAYNPTVFTQNGYFVLRPDIVYRDRNPGLSAVEALVPAVRTVLETGMIDPHRVGIVGHSWGAYQTAFAVTQTDMFAAAVAGAPLTNLISMYLSIYWNTGGTDARIFEVSQGRMEVPFWQDVDSYIANSPVFHIENMDTPLLVAFGDKDGAVEFNQGVELYNAARRAGKDMILLVYEGENHSLAQRPNQLDYHRRINEWFGHYLKGEPAPDWITRGVRHVDRQRELELQRRAAPAGGGR
jgi:dipeptidyl aminopeptidase/acylaminoacyl peptidase